MKVCICFHCRCMAHANSVVCKTTHLLTLPFNSATHQLTHPPTHPSTQPPIQSIYPHTHSATHPCSIYLSTLPPMHLPTPSRSHPPSPEEGLFCKPKYLAIFFVPYIFYFMIQLFCFRLLRLSFRTVLAHIFYCVSSPFIVTDYFPLTRSCC